MTENGNCTYIVSCVSAKSEYSCEAGEMYQSVWFKKAIEFIGARDYYIISAKYGLLHPHDFIQPYNLSLYDLDVKTRVEWGKSVSKSIQKKIPYNQTIVFLAGKTYIKYIIGHLNNYKVGTPLKGLGIGQQLKWFGDNTL